MIKTVSPGSLSGTLAVMPSKSASHRAVMMAAMAGGQTRLAPLQLSKDIQATLDCAQALGLIDAPEILPHQTPGFVSVRIHGGQSVMGGGLRTLDCGESGSTLRFFIPLALDGRGPVRFVGHGRLMQRPLDVYESLFKPLGIRWALDESSLTVEGKLTSGEYHIPGDVSSQFITGLLLALPRLEGDSILHITTRLESRAYVELTRRVQQSFGVTSHWKDDGQTLFIPGNQKMISPIHAHVESDWSHAAFYLVAGAIGSAGMIRLTGLDLDSAQGDRAILHILEQMGAVLCHDTDSVTVCSSRLRAVHVDASQIPDLVPILAVAMAAAEGESRITGAARLRIKESDRLRAMHAALSAAGADVTELEDGLIIRGGKPLHAAHIDGCNDHRIVMSMAIAAAISSGSLTISDAQAVAKSAPAFWEEYASLGGQAEEAAT
ncbi:MAG: 3-phosphoshikimate 1-carboxyvinyltransferase [Clostridia bacterium]|nr:3-phosphoshikimate 1-carboxyvinyltransferase [Clostridia bacterium]